MRSFSYPCLRLRRHLPYTGWAFCRLVCKFCLDGPTDLKLGRKIVFGKISRYGEKNRKEFVKKLLKMLISAFFEHSFHENRAFTRNAIKPVPDVVFQFGFNLQQVNRL